MLKPADKGKAARKEGRVRQIGELAELQVRDSDEVGGWAEAASGALCLPHRAVHGLDEGIAAVIEYPSHYVFADGDSRVSREPGVPTIHMHEHYGALSPILQVLPLQLLAHHTACARGTDVDKPRNLAKSDGGVRRASSPIRLKKP